MIIYVYNSMGRTTAQLHKQLPTVESVFSHYPLPASETGDHEYLPQNIWFESDTDC